jgi:hypothetical protein
MVKTRTLICALLVAADCRRPRRGEPLAGRSDRDASWSAIPEQLDQARVNSILSPSFRLAI